MKGRGRRRGTRAQACDGKERMMTLDEAVGKAYRYQAQTGTARMNAYRCRFCRFWHIGHGRG